MFNDFIRAGALRRFVVGGIILVLIVLSGVDAGKADIMKVWNLLLRLNCRLAYTQELIH